MAVQIDGKTARRIGMRASGPDARKQRHDRGPVTDKAGSWMEPLKFAVNITPQPKERARASVTIKEKEVRQIVTECGGDSQTIAKRIIRKLSKSLYTPSSTRRYEKAVRDMASVYMTGHTPLNEPVVMTLTFVLAGDADTWPTAVSDGDLDNLEKAAKDAMNKVAYKDDRLVVHTTKTKVCGAHPRVEIEVQPARWAEVSDGAASMPSTSANVVTA